MPGTGTQLLDILKIAVQKISNYDFLSIPLGIYLEGPFLSKNKMGALSKDWISPPDLDKLKRYYEITKDLLKIMTVAPEVDGIDKVLDYAKDNNIILSIGHTNANYDIALAALKTKRYELITHLFNAMNGINHRDPGVIEAIFSFDNLFCEIICDRIHLHPATINLILRNMSIDKLIMITDGTSAMGSNLSSIKLLNKKVIIENNRAYTIIDGKETLVGSTLPMNARESPNPA